LPLARGVTKDCDAPVVYGALEVSGDF